MKFLVIALGVIMASNSAANPGDTIRSYSIPGSPAMGLLGIAKDWDTGNIWIGGANGTYNSKFAAMDPVTLEIVTPWITYTDVYWGFDIGYGYEMGGKKYLLMTDQESPFVKLIDPDDGSCDGSLPDYYAAGDLTEGCSVDWNTNDVYLSSFYDADCVYYEGSSYNVFSTVSNPQYLATAVGWAHVFFLRYGPWRIDVYDLDSGEFVESNVLTGVVGNYLNSLSGLACGRENAVGNNESLFLYGNDPKLIYEIEVGDYATSASLDRVTWGEIKTGFSF